MFFLLHAERSNGGNLFALRIVQGDKAHMRQSLHTDFVPLF